MVYTVTPNPALDYYMEVDAVQPGALHRAPAVRLHPGGKGVNVAIVLSRLGCPARALGFTAGQTGGLLAGLLGEDGVETDFIPVPDGMTRINVKVCADRETEFNGPGPSIPPEAFDALLTQVERLRADDVLVVAGAAPADLPPDAYTALLSRAAARGALTVADTTGPHLLALLPCRPFLIKPNGQELAELFGGPAENRDALLARVKTLQSAGARNVLVSFGGSGALLCTEDGALYESAAPAGTVISAVGAGDSMVAGFLAGWLGTHDYGTAFRTGVAAGSATAFSPWLAEADAVNALLAQVLT